jgi:hypothetical protein
MGRTFRDLVIRGMDGVIEHVDETRRREAELAGFEDEALGRAFGYEVTLRPVEPHGDLAHVFGLDEIEIVT